MLLLLQTLQDNFRFYLIIRNRYTKQLLPNVNVTVTYPNGNSNMFISDNLAQVTVMPTAENPLLKGDIIRVSIKSLPDFKDLFTAMTFPAWSNGGVAVLVEPIPLVDKKFRLIVNVSTGAKCVESRIIFMVPGLLSWKEKTKNCILDLQCSESDFKLEMWYSYRVQITAPKFRTEEVNYTMLQTPDSLNITLAPY